MIPLLPRLVQLANLNGTTGESALGIRPEDVRVVLDQASSGDLLEREVDVLLPASVSLVEPVGSDLFVSATTGDLAWTARAEARLPIQPGQRIGLALDLQRAHLFGADGRNLSLAP